ncbi:hypothetical protein DWY22_02735 [Heyndrickxia coagulans]|nr:hypothetical protein DWY22_02735 [Heyndrickxia coagulans]RGR98145.1 hypothetical protein DWY16_08780 [Heyndrickxia coagulans]
MDSTENGFRPGKAKGNASAGILGDEFCPPHNGCGSCHARKRWSSGHKRASERRQNIFGDNGSGVL